MIRLCVGRGKSLHFNISFLSLVLSCAFHANVAVAIPNLRYEARDWVDVDGAVELAGLLGEVDYALAAFNENLEPNIQETEARLNNGTRYSNCVPTGGWGIPLFAVVTKKNERFHFTSAATDFDIRKVSADTVELTFRFTIRVAKDNGSRIPFEVNISPLSCDFSLFATTMDFNAGFSVENQSGSNLVNTRVTLLAKRISDVNRSDKRYEIIGQPVIEEDIIFADIESPSTFAPTLVSLDPSINFFLLSVIAEAKNRIESAYDEVRDDIIDQAVGALTRLAEKGLSIMNSANPAKYFYENALDDLTFGFQTTSADPSAFIDHSTELGAVFVNYPQIGTNVGQVFPNPLPGLYIPAPSFYVPTNPNLLSQEALLGAPYVNYGDFGQLYATQLKVFEYIGFFGSSHPYYSRSFTTDAYDYLSMTPAGPLLVQNASINTTMSDLTLVYDPTPSAEADGGSVLVIYNMLVNFNGLTESVSGHYRVPLEEEFYPDRAKQFWDSPLATKFFQNFDLVLSGLEHIPYSHHSGLGALQSQALADSVVPAFAFPAATSPSLISTETESIAWGSPKDMKAAVATAGLPFISDNGNKVDWDRLKEILPQNLRAVNVYDPSASEVRYGRFHDYFLQEQTAEPKASISRSFRPVDQGKGVMTVSVSPADENKARALIGGRLVTAVRRNSQQVKIYQDLYLASEQYNAGLENGTLHMVLEYPGQEFEVTAQGYEGWQKNNRFQICSDSVRVKENTGSTGFGLIAEPFVAEYATQVPLVDASTGQIVEEVYSAPDAPNCGEGGGEPGTGHSGPKAVIFEGPGNVTGTSGGKQVFESGTQ